MENKNYFKELNDINVSDKIEEKNNLSYLSWAWAWAEIKKIHPNANYKIYEREDGCIYWNDGKTAWVKTGVSINNIEHIEYLPVMDFKNQSIFVENIKSTDINKSIQRSLTKAVARHGLGLYVYAGEDLPEVEKEPKPKQEAKKCSICSKEIEESTYFGSIKKYGVAYCSKDCKDKTDKILIPETKEEVEV